MFTFTMPKTPVQWGLLIVGVAVVIALLFQFTRVFRGEAVEVTVQNSRTEAIFAYIDNIGRHEKGTQVVRLKKGSGETPTGMSIEPGASRSFGLAVGFGDQPTLHVMPLTENGTAVDANRISDCALDTVSLSKPQLPPWHVTVKVEAAGCTTTR